jgi:hypothetical protein
VTEQNAEELTRSASGGSGATGAQPDPPAANQGKDEPIATTPDESAQASDGRSEAGAGSSNLVPGDTGEPAGAMEVDDVRGAANMADAATMPAHTTGGVPTPGDSKGVAVPAVQAAAGTSEQGEKVDGVNITALAPPGKPDGEVDTRA